jgi:hypothetical protein
MPHSLKYAGAPYDDQAQLISKNTAGPGRALCSCGIISPTLPSGSARRAWFAEHKAKYDVPPAPVAEPVTASVEFPATVAKHFWLSLGHASANFLRLNHPDLLVTHDDDTRVITLKGDEALVRQVEAQLQRMYDDVAPAFYVWKKTDEEYKALEHTTLEGRRASYQLVKNFFVGFARQHLHDGLL